MGINAHHAQECDRLRRQAEADEIRKERGDETFSRLKKEALDQARHGLDVEGLSLDTVLTLLYLQAYANGAEFVSSRWKTANLQRQP